MLTSKRAAEELSNSDASESSDHGTYSSQTGSQTRASVPGSDSAVDQCIRDKIVKKEEKAVRKARVVVIVALVLCAAAVSAAVYSFASKGDVTTFELDFEGYTKDIITIVQWDVQYNFALMKQVTAQTTTAALLTGATFPNLTQPEFEISAGFADGMGGIMAVAYAPRISVEQRAAWEAYSVANQDWLTEAERLKIVHPTHRDALHGTFQDHEHDRRTLEGEMPSISETIWKWEDGDRVPEENKPFKTFYPLWQVSPPKASAVNVNFLSDDRLRRLYDAMIATNQSVLSAASPIGEVWDWMFDPDEKMQKSDPHAFLMEPVYKSFQAEGEREMVGILVGLTSWKNIMDRLLPKDANGVVCVVRDTCGNVMTFQLDGQVSKFLGYEDLHDPTYDRYERTVRLEMYEKVVSTMCIHDLHVYPSVTFQDSYKTNKPAIYTSVVMLAFVVTSLFFVLYDCMVSRRQEKTMANALRTNKLVDSLFPENVRERLMEDAEKRDNVGKTRKDAFLAGKSNKDNDGGRPIADFFPRTTVMFADIAGFTAWSSTREPIQVFQLLETIYGALDEIARRRRVFKVETVGDCYVAVTGMPEPRKNHAVVMARFARDCIFTMNDFCRKLEVSLGPDTGDLGFRIGLHSGPVTGGVLRGQNTRFQLFGDTMNTAARIESTGMRGSVHLSKETADLLQAAGKSHWLKPRADKVVAKGKGELETFWLRLESETTASNHSGSTGRESDVQPDNLKVKPKGVPAVTAMRELDPTRLNSKDRRLVEWNKLILVERLKHVIAQREGQEITKVEIGESVLQQIENHVAGIAVMYRKNRFHNFEHASHVCMSTIKILSRVVDATDDSTKYLTGIGSDALTQFAVVYSALIHDVDHQGVPNAQLVKERANVAVMYDGKSVAEKNSIAVACNFLMQPEFDELRQVLCPTSTDWERFHELVVNTVLATDIVDKDLKADRNARWAKVFHESASQADDNINHLKATIVLEHLIQTSDVCHTMQHWHIYRKWNERLFVEMYKAYKDGRSQKDPAEFWYQGEIGFFDFYIIPLAQKLSECGVFGVSSDEFLNYAKHNRKEWELKGQQVVAELVEQYCEDQKTEAPAAAVSVPITEMKEAVQVQPAPAVPSEAAPSVRQLPVTTVKSTSGEHMFL